MYKFGFAICTDFALGPSWPRSRSLRDKVGYRKGGNYPAMSVRCSRVPSTAAGLSRSRVRPMAALWPDTDAAG